MKRIDHAMYDQIMALRDTGMSLRDIGLSVSVNRQSVADALRRGGPPRTTRDMERKPIIATPDNMPAAWVEEQRLLALTSGAAAPGCSIGGRWE